MSSSSSTSSSPAGWLGLFREAIATHDYEPDDVCELALKTGQVVHIAGQRNEDWLIGMVRNETTGLMTWGLFPSSFCTAASVKKSETTTTTTTTTISTTTPSAPSGPPIRPKRQPNLRAREPEQKLSTSNNNDASVRRELHEYYFRYHRQKMHNLKPLLKSYIGNYDALYQGLLSQFGTSPADLPPHDAALEAPKQISADDTSLCVTWMTRELYEKDELELELVESLSQGDEQTKDLDLDRHGKHAYSLALEIQDAMLPLSSCMSESSGGGEDVLNNSASWRQHVLYIKEDERVCTRMNRLTGVTTCQIMGLSKGCEYRCRLTLYDHHDRCAIKCRRTPISHVKTSGGGGASVSLTVDLPGMSSSSSSTSRSSRSPSQTMRPASWQHFPTSSSSSAKMQPPIVPQRKSTVITSTVLPRRPERPERSITSRASEVEEEVEDEDEEDEPPAPPPRKESSMQLRPTRPKVCFSFSLLFFLLFVLVSILCF